MILKIELELLSKEVLDNLLIDFISRESTDYGEIELDYATKKSQLLTQIKQNKVHIVFYTKTLSWGIISADEWFRRQQEQG